MDDNTLLSIVTVTAILVGGVVAWLADRDEK